MKSGVAVMKPGILRLRKTIRFASRLAPLRMTGGKRIVMRRVLFLMLLTWSGLASATTYYVSSSTGNDANSGTSVSTSWQTIGHVNGQTFQPGDSILFKRGDIWNESLAPASSGSSGNPITFDAYGTGAAPNLTGYYAVPSTAWVLVTGNAWKAAVPATYTTINFCLFGSVWGQKVATVSSNLTARWDFYLANGYVYVYSVGNPATYYNEPIVPMALSNVPVININGRSWLTFQHFLVNWFDQYGVYVQGASDHLAFANMESDSMIPQGTQPLGFYVNESAPGPGDIKIYNAEAHMNYDGFRFDGAATAITMVNDKAYANRDGALVDNTGAVTYSYCHFYASSLAVAGSTDVEWTSGSGPIAGAGNVGADTAPAVQVYQRYPAEVTLTVDDSGMTAGADTYYASTVLPIADAAAVPVGAAITVGYPLAQTLVSEFQGWVNAGRDVTSHSMSHTYYTNTDALEIQYTGSGTAAMLSISGKTLTITVTGAADSVSYNLAQGQTQGTIKAVRLALLATGKFTATEVQTCQGPYGTGCSAYTESALLAQDLADVSSQDVRTSVYHMQLDVTRLTTDEITLSRQWMTTNLTGLPATPVYVYPGGYETTTMQGITEGVPYAGARGALKEDLGVSDTYADGFNVQNITSFGVNPSWQLLQPAVLNQKIQALVWKESVWGVPWGIFWHLNELSSTEITNLIQDFKASGATIQTNTGLVNWLLGGTQEIGTDGNYYYTFPATSMTLDFRPTKNSPVVDAGQNLGTEYALDINGVNQNNYGSGWEIGAHVYEGYGVYGAGAGAGTFTIGLAANTPALAALPQVWVNNHQGDSLFTYELSLPGTWVSGPAPSCTFHAPYWTGTPTSSGLQSAINDIEACRTATGVGIKLDIPPALYTSANGLVIPQSSSTLATNYLILDSTMDANLPNGQIVCAHGMQDNLSTATDIGLDNPDCAGDAMYYELGTTQTTIPAGAFTLANGFATNTSNYNDVQYMWTAECSGVSNCVPFQTCWPEVSGTNPPPCTSTTIAPDHWLIEDMEARPNLGNSGDNYVVAVSQNSASPATSLSQLGAHIHFRKVWAHGDWSTLPVGSNSISAGFSLFCTNCSIVDSQVSQALRPGAEGHSINAQGTTYKIDHNWLEGSSSCAIAGGNSLTAGPSIVGSVPFQDVEMRRNRCTFPYAWLGLLTVTNSNVHWGGQSIERKNIWEIKEGERVLSVGNIFENSDNSGGQGGPIGDFNVRNTAAGGTGANYQSTLNDLTIGNNIWRNACEGLELSTSSFSATSNGGGVSFSLRRMDFFQSLIYNVSVSNPGCTGVNNEGFSITSASQQWTGNIVENSAGTMATFTALCSVDAGNVCPPPIGFQVTDISPGDPVVMLSCTNAAFNVASHTVSAHVVPLGVGPLAAVGTNPSSLVVTYPWVTAGNSSDTSGTCTLGSVERGPQQLNFSHLSVISDSRVPLGEGNAASTGPAYAVNNLIQDSIFLTGTGGSVLGFNNSAVGEGTPTEGWNYDHTSLTADHLVWPTRTSSNYTAYGNNPFYPVASPVMYFPATAYCTGSTSTSACVGFQGAMSMSAMPLTLTDYHNFELRSDSVFSAGQADAASDGTAMGANIPAIDAAQTQNVYVCQTACGSAGPYPDNPGGGIGGVAVAPVMPLTTGQSSLYSVLVSNVLPAQNVFAAKPAIKWNDVESNTTPGSYSWTTIDAQLLTLAAAGKRLPLTVELANESGQAYNATSGNDATPAYVFGSSWATTTGASSLQDMAVCANYPGDTSGPYGQPGFTNGGVWNSSNATYGSDLSGLPVSYELPFKTAAKNFVTQVTQHFSSACAIYSSDCANAASIAALIEYVQVGFTAGAEDVPLCINYWPLPAGYITFQGAYLDGSTSGGQTGYVDEMTAYIANTYAAYHPAWTFIFDTNDVGGGGVAGHVYADHEAMEAANAGFGFGTDGLQASDLVNCPGPNCTGDWYTNFALYPNVPHYLQTFQVSCPDNSCQTGSLPPLLAFGLAHGATAFEIYACDLLLADAPSMYPGTGTDACSPVFSTAYSPAYAAAIAVANGN